MTFKNFTMALLATTSMLTASACHVTTSPTYTECYYDWWGNYVCETYYYDADGNTEAKSRDIITDMAEKERILLEGQAKHFAEKFALTEEQGMKIARTVNDYNAVQNRSEQDMADFAKRLYGVDPNKITAAVGAAQVGNNAQLNSLVGEAAANFNVKTDTMKDIVKTLHGRALKDQGIDF